MSEAGSAAAPGPPLTGSDPVDSMDDLAAFLMHRSLDRGVTDRERLETYALVSAYEDHRDPVWVESALRRAGARFSAHRDYREEWSAASSSRPEETGATDLGPGPPT